MCKCVFDSLTNEVLYSVCVSVNVDFTQNADNTIISN